MLGKLLCWGKMINALCQVLIKWCGTCTVSFLFLGRILVTASKQSGVFPELSFCSLAPNELSSQPASCYVHVIKYVPCFNCLLFLFYFYCFCGFFSSPFIFLFLLLGQLREIVRWLLLKYFLSSGYCKIFLFHTECDTATLSIPKRVGFLFFFFFFFLIGTFLYAYICTQQWTKAKKFSLSKQAKTPSIFLSRTQYLSIYDITVSVLSESTARELFFPNYMPYLLSLFFTAL